MKGVFFNKQKIYFSGCLTSHLEWMKRRRGSGFWTNEFWFLFSKRRKKEKRQRANVLGVCPKQRMDYRILFITWGCFVEQLFLGPIHPPPPTSLSCAQPTQRSKSSQPQTFAQEPSGHARFFVRAFLLGPFLHPALLLTRGSMSPYPAATDSSTLTDAFLKFWSPSCRWVRTCGLTLSLRSNRLSQNRHLKVSIGCSGTFRFFCLRISRWI